MIARGPRRRALATCMRSQSDRAESDTAHPRRRDDCFVAEAVAGESVGFMASDTLAHRARKPDRYRLARKRSGDESVRNSCFRGVGWREGALLLFHIKESSESSYPVCGRLLGFATRLR